MSVQPNHFTYSDLIAGYVTRFDDEEDAFGLRTSDGREFRLHLTGNTFAVFIRNLGDAYQDATANLRDMLVPERFVFAYGISYPEGGGTRFEVKQLVFAGRHRDEYVFEQPSWWVNQSRAVADFYLTAQFPDGKYDYANYRTKIALDGAHLPGSHGPDYRQETDTISRMVYGLASAFLLTGEDRFLEAAERGTEYLRDHMRVTDDERNLVYWYHGIDVHGDHERKILASEFGDDYQAIPMYEQIYALAGPTQTYRVTGDPRILSDIQRTHRLFEQCFKDESEGGYFSHLDPVTFDPRSDALVHNRARKNWNSVGDHAPAYLINALLATELPELEEFLIATGDTIAKRFPDDARSPFVQERFHEDWSPDRRWGWQQDNAVCGHNLKIAWNLMRMHARRPNEAYEALARKIAATMPAVASDQQRGGWYDVVERATKPGQEWHRYVWHDRKAWWQQEQAILAYLILHGVLGEPEYLRLARESAAFYNAFFLDHTDGGVYFNVLANGIPYLVDTERLKGSHSMSSYHSIELCYLAAVYTNLLITKEPLDLHFRPRADADRVLHVAPDLLPKGSVRLTNVWIGDREHTDFDPEALTIRLPQSSMDLRVRVRVAPAVPVFEVRLERDNGTARIRCKGELGVLQVTKLRVALEQAAALDPKRVVLHVAEVTTMCREALNEILFVGSKLGVDSDLVVVGANPKIASDFRDADRAVLLVDDEAALKATAG
jgi:mannose/cellobiose epimerase-like protein (N-acyl-D-glucosamine 2-epimerase family)